LILDGLEGPPIGEPWKNRGRTVEEVRDLAAVAKPPADTLTVTLRLELGQTMARSGVLVVNALMTGLVT